MKRARNRGKSVSGEGTARTNPRGQKNMALSRNSKEDCVAEAKGWREKGGKWRREKRTWGENVERKERFAETSSW